MLAACTSCLTLLLFAHMAELYCCLHTWQNSTAFSTHGRTLLLFAHMAELYCCLHTWQNSVAVSTHGRILLLFPHMAEFYCCFHTWQNSTVVFHTWQNSTVVSTHGRILLLFSTWQNSTVVFHMAVFYSLFPHMAELYCCLHTGQTLSVLTGSKYNITKVCIKMQTFAYKNTNTVTRNINCQTL